MQGQFDVQDGVLSTNAWVSRLSWPRAAEFERQAGEVWLVDGQAAGWRRRVGQLTQVVLRNAGHMVPRDQPRAALHMVQAWVADVLAEGQQQRWGRETDDGVAAPGVS